LTGPLIDAILSALGTRFAGYSDRSELIIASVTLPQFRLRWLDDAKKAAAGSLMYEYVTAVLYSNRQQPHHRISTTSVGQWECQSRHEDDFFCFEAQHY